MFWGDGLSESDIDSCRCRYGLGSGPCFEGAVDNDRYGGGFGFSGDKFESAFDAGDFSVVGPGGFGEQDDGAAGLEAFDDGSDGGEVGLVPVDGKGVK